MLTANYNSELSLCDTEKVNTFIDKEPMSELSYSAKFIAFKHRSKIEFLKFFVV